RQTGTRTRTRSHSRSRAREPQAVNGAPPPLALLAVEEDDVVDPDVVVLAGADRPVQGDQLARRDRLRARVAPACLLLGARERHPVFLPFRRQRDVLAEVVPARLADAGLLVRVDV